MLSDDYEQEQEELREKLLQLNEEITEHEEQPENIDRFISKVHKYLELSYAYRPFDGDFLLLFALWLFFDTVLPQFGHHRIQKMIRRAEVHPYGLFQ